MCSFSFKLQELAEIVGGDLVGDPEMEIRGVAGIREAEAGDITFVANPRYEEFVDATRASAVIATPRLNCAKPAIRINNPYFAYLKILTMFAKQNAVTYDRGVHETAVIGPDVILGDGICIGPHCHVARGAKIGDNTTIVSNTFIGEGVSIGADCLLYPNVTIRERTEMGDRVILQPGVVIGGDGFGYAKDGGVHHKVPQIGRVVIEDDVEIGANSAVDRATTGETRIGRGCKIDNLVQIAHNVEMGEHTVSAAQSGISGSSIIGSHVTLGGQAGLAGHIKIGNGAMLAAQSGVTKDVPANTSVSGYPAREHTVARKIYAHTARLPELSKRVKELEKIVEQLQKGETVDSSTKNDL